MRLKSFLIALLLAGPFVWAFAAQAGTTTFQGVTVDYGNASMSLVGGELVLQYKTAGTSSLTISDGAVVADVLVVGGGGGGGGSYYASKSGDRRYGTGGGGGSVLEKMALGIAAQKLTITIGAGGEGGAHATDQSGTSASQGKAGGDSSVAGSLFGEIRAYGGAGGSYGNTSSVAGGGVERTSAIVSGKFGTGGAAAGNGKSTATAGGKNTGTGGQAGSGSTSTQDNQKGASGGSGIVVVRLTGVCATADVTLADVSLGQLEEVSDFTVASSGSSVGFRHDEVLGVTFSEAGVAKASRTRTGAFVIVGLQPGETRAEIVTWNANTKTITSFAVKVTVNPSVRLADKILRRGETSTAFILKDSGEPIDFAAADVKDLKSSRPQVAEPVRTADGRVGIIGRVQGSAEVTIIRDGWSYVCTVEVEPLVTGSFRIGAYEVAVTNASEVKYVEGDLVIAYLNTNAAVAKSFALPRSTTGRLLVVGGGGAGGQDADRSSNCGLPGGGGAGGMLVYDSQPFAGVRYAVTVGAGGVAPRSATLTAGANGGDSTVAGNGKTLKAQGGGGGGARSVGNAGGSGGGGSASYASKITQKNSGGDGTSGQGSNGGAGNDAKYGAGGGGAGDAGNSTTSSSSGAGGAGMTCDITGESVEYARGGDGGVPRVNSTYTMDGKTFSVEASDGKPGLDGRGDGGGGGGHYSSSATFAGSGGSGIVVVRIPPYKTTVEDALRAAFAGQPVTVSDRTVILADDVTGPIAIPDNLGAVTIKLGGNSIIGADGADGDDITPGGGGQPALKIVPHEYDCESGATVLSVTGTGSLKGGNGGKGYPGGAGAEAVAADGFTVTVADGIAVTAGTAGESYVQHPHKWAYTVKDNKIVAYCVAEDGEPCSYRDLSRGPFVAVSAADAAYTAMRYDELTTVNGITPVTGIVVAPETYVGREGTVYPESSTPPREQGAYTVNMQLGDLKITSDFTITESKAPQGSVYQAWKTAERKGRDVQIALSATFDGSKAINDGNVLFLGSRCSAHSMANGTVESSVNALSRYANVRWYAYGSRDPSNNLREMLTKKGETISGGVVGLVGGNHFVFKDMMNDLYEELVEKKNLDTDYDLLILEFDGDLLCRNGEDPYQLVYSLPEGWTDEKAAVLRQEMSRYYAENRVVWIVPDVDQPKSDQGYTGTYPWVSNPKFVWQRAFLNATETEGYQCPLQKNYEKTDELVAFLQEVLVGHFFSNAVIKDTLASGLTIKKVTPQMRSGGGVWRNFEGGPSHYTIPEPRSETTVKADVEQVGRQVKVTFDMKEEQAWACEHDQVIGDDFRVVIDASLDGFFSGTTGEWQETNEGSATFTFTESNLDDDEEDYTITIEKDSPKIQNVKLTPDYTSEDVVRIYDGKGTNIVVKPIAPIPSESDIRYSLDEHGTYADTLALTNVCEKTKVWFEITDKNGDFTTVTNFATVTILPRVVAEQAEDAEKPFDGTPLTQPAHSNVLSRAIAEAEQMYPGQGASAAGFVEGEGFASVPMTADSQQIDVGSHPNTIDRAAVTVNEKTDKNNYVFIYLPGVLTVTPPLPMGIEAFDAEKFYDAEPTNITHVVTNANGVAITDATISLREKGTDVWIPAADFALYVDTTNVTVEVRAEKSGFNPVTAEATVDIWPRPVTLIAASDSKTYDGLPLTNWTFTVKTDTTTPGYGFVKDEGVALVTMTPESTVTLPDSVPNVIATETAKPDTKLERNYILSTEPGTLTVTAATMGIEAFDAEKFYDAEPTNITYVVTNANGVAITDAAISLREKGTDVWIPAADFTLYVDTTNVTVEVRAEKSGFNPVTAEATVDIWPRPVTLIAASDSKVYDGLPLTNWTFTVKTDTTTPGYGFVKDEGVASVTMTPESTVTLPDSVPNVIATETAKPDTKLERNYILSTEPGTLAVTAASMGIAAFDAEKFYDADPTNVTYVVTNAAGVAITDATISLREKGATDWIPVADFVPYVDTTNVTVEVRAEKSGFDACFAEATVIINPRPVTLIAASDSKTYDGLPLTNWNFTVATDTTTPGYGFVKDEGVALVTMTDDSTITDPGSADNVIATTVAKEGTKLERNYIVSTEKGTLTVTAATMGIEAFDAEKFYDAEPTNITYVVTNANGVAITDATISLREKGATDWIPVADFVPYVDTTNVTVEVRAEKSGFNPVTAEATVDIWPRPVTLIAASDSKVYDGLPLTNWTFTVATDTTTPGYGFVKDEGVALVTMTGDSTITLPGSVPNVIATETAKPDTKLERNYIVSTEKGTLTVTAASMGIAAFDAEKFYDADPTNVTYVVTNAAGVAITDAAISLREKGTDVWIPVADFIPYVDTTNVTVEVRAEKSGFDACFAEATVVINPRPVTLIAASDSKVYDGLPLTNWTFTVKTDTTTPGYGFVKEEGVASVTMTDDSTITDPGTQPNVIATEVAKPDTKLERNYILSTEPGTLTVTPAAFTASATPYDEFYDGQEHTIEIDIQKPEEAGEATVAYSYEEGGTYLPIEDFEQLKNVTAGGPVTVYAKVEIEGYSTVVVSSTVNIKPRIVVEQAESASKIFDGTPLVQPSHHEETAVETEKSKEKWGTDEALPDSTGFVVGEGFADVPMTAGSTITEPGVEDNVIDAAAVTLLDGTKSGNYIFFYLPGELMVIQRQEEVRRDPEIPEESKKVVEESDKKIEKTLDEMAKNDQEATGETYVKYQMTVTPTNSLSEATRTTPEKAAEDAKEQIELAESETGSKIDKVEFVDIVLERTYSKEEAEATAAGDYNKDNWEPLDKAEEHGNRLFEVVVPVEVPEGMELIGVTRSCDNKGTEILRPKDPSNPNAEGFVYDSETKAVTLFAYDFCVFGFMMQEKTIPPSPPHGGCEPEDEKLAACVYQFKANLYTTKGVIVRNPTASVSPCAPSAASPCLVMRGRDKTVLEGWIYDCTCTCGALQNAKAVIWDSVRKVQLADAEFSTDLLNIIGARNTDAEWVWALKGTANHDAVRAQDFEMVGAGYGAFERSVGLFSGFSGAVAGTASASYDLAICFRPEIASCICEPSSVLKCDSVSSLDFIVEDTVVFGKWKVKYNAAASAAYEKTGRLKLPGYVKMNKND